MNRLYRWILKVVISVFLEHDRHILTPPGLRDILLCCKVMARVRTYSKNTLGVSASLPPHGGSVRPQSAAPASQQTARILRPIWSSTNISIIPIELRSAIEPRWWGYTRHMCAVVQTIQLAANSSSFHDTVILHKFITTACERGQ